MTSGVRRDIALALWEHDTPECYQCSAGSEWNICQSHLEIFLAKADAVLAVIPAVTQWGSGPDPFHIATTTEWHARTATNNRRRYKAWTRVVRTITSEWVQA